VDAAEVVDRNVDRRRGGKVLDLLREADLTPLTESRWEVIDFGNLDVFKEEGKMPGKRFGAEQIIPKLREAEVDLAKGLTVAQACNKIGVTEQTYYRWRKEYGGIRMDQAKRMKDLEKENARLKRLLADAELDKAILREAASGNF
jgi:putative transposase